MSVSARVAYEGIMFQANSSLGKDLTASLEKAFVYRDGLSYEGIDEKQIPKYRLAKMLEYCKKTLFPSLVQDISKNTNLKIRKVIPVLQCCGCFAIDMKMDNLWGALSILNKQSGMDRPSKRGTPQKSFVDSVKEMQEMYKNLDLKTGKLTKNTYGKDDKREIFGTLYFDVQFAFLLYDNFPKTAVEELNAAELAAVLMHETGHVMTMVERSSDEYLTIERISEITEGFRDIPVHDPIEAAKAVADLTTTLSKVINVDKKGLDLISKLVTATAAIATTREKASDDDYSESVGRSTSGALSVLLNVLLRALTFVALSASYILLNVVVRRMDRNARLVYTSVKTALRIATSNKKNNSEILGYDDKSSDVADAKQNMYQLERMADEFVSRHGYGAQLAAALAKLYNVAELIDTTGRHVAVISDSIFVGRLIKWQATFSSLMNRRQSAYGRACARFLGIQVPENYEGEIARNKRLLQNTKGALKGALPPEDVGAYLLEYEQINAVLESQYKELRNNRAVQSLQHFFSVIGPRLGLIIKVLSIVPSLAISPAIVAAGGVLITIGMLFPDTRPSTELEEYTKLLNEISELINNNFYYYGAKFGNMAR